MQQKIWKYVVSSPSCLLLAVCLGGCSGGMNGGGGNLLNDVRAGFDTVNQFSGPVRQLQNNLQTLMVKLSVYASVRENTLQNVKVDTLIKTLTELSGNLASGGSGVEVDKVVMDIYWEMPIALRLYWGQIAIPMVTKSINIQASYLNVLVQYINKNAFTLMPAEVKRLNDVLGPAITTLNGLGI